MLTLWAQRKTLIRAHRRNKSPQLWHSRRIPQPQWL